MDTIYSYKIFTLTHKNTHLNDIGHFVLSEKDSDVMLKERLLEIKKLMGMRELMYLATCNRVMFFFSSDDNADGQFYPSKFINTVYAHLGADIQQIAQKNALIFEGREAISHLFEVAASMDSMVVGEREILRQLRETYEKNQELGLTGDAIRLAMRFCVEAAKKVYSSTKIGEKPVSVVSLSIQKMLEKKLPVDARFLLIGAGQTNRLVIKFLQKHSYKNITVFNRSLKSAQKLASIVGGEAYTLDSLPEYTKGFDAVFAATASTETILTNEMYSRINGEDMSQKLLIDLSIPANIDASIAQNHNAEYVPIEALRELAQANIGFREQELGKSQEIVDEYVEIFHTAFKERQIELAMREVPEQIKAIRAHALNNVFKNEISELDEQQRELFDRVLAYMEKRCIAIPIQVAKEKLAHS
jgi:glutamyl-tRNA reductase